MKIPFVDLHAQYLTIKEEVDGAIAEVIAESAYIRGRPRYRMDTLVAEWRPNLLQLRGWRLGRFAVRRHSSSRRGTRKKPELVRRRDSARLRRTRDARRRSRHLAGKRRWREADTRDEQTLRHSLDAGRRA